MVDLLIQKLMSKKLNIDDFDMNDKFTNDIIVDMNKNNLIIGQGAVGKVFLVENQKYVVKQVTPCKAKKDTPLYKYCQDILNINDNLIQIIPGGNNKYRYILPNLLSEIIIGIIMGKLDLNYASTLRSMILIDKNNLSIYIIMNKFEPFVINKTINENFSLDTKQLKLILFQIAYSILNAQQKFKFTHYDLHVENLLYDQWPDGKNYIYYVLPNTNNKIILSKKDCPYIIKISDYALGRLEIDDIIVAPSVDNYPVNTYGEFNYSYDFGSFIGSIVIDNKYRQLFDNLFMDIKIYKYMLKLILWFFKDNTNINNYNLEKLDEVRNYIGNTYYKSIGKTKNKFSFRLKQDNDFIPYINTKSMVDVVNYLAKDLLSLKLLTNYNNEKNIIITQNLSPYKIYDTVKLFNPNLDITIEPKKYKSEHKKYNYKIDKYINVSKYHIVYNDMPKKYNFTVEEKQLLNCPLQDHYVTAIYINKNHNYNFKYDCCKLDAINYLLQNDKIGFVINGGFFSVKKDYLPIGIYKDQHNKIDNYDVPEKYKDVYGYIVLKNNKLNIVRKYEDDDMVCTSGPILIENNKIVFKSNDERFICADKKHNNDLMISQDDKTITLSGYYNYKLYNGVCIPEFVDDVKTVARCDKINPGDLEHANNPNPRSALCIMDNGDYVFLVFEGRDHNGVGIDLYSLSKSILLSYPNVMSAINLDGGRSSTLAWRSVHEPNIVYNTNPDRHYYYPHGNIIGLFK